MDTSADDFSRALKMLAGMTAETVESRRVAGAVTEVAADWLAPHYLLALRGQMATQTDSENRFKLMRKAARDVAAFQRGGLLSARLQLDREKLEFKRQIHRDKIAGNLPEEKRLDFNREMTEAELKACVDKVDEIMGLKKVPRKRRRSQAKPVESDPKNLPDPRPETHGAGG